MAQLFCGAVCMRVGALVARCSIDCPPSPGRFVCKARCLIIALSALGFGGLLLGFSNASSFGLASPHIWVPAILGVLFLVLYLRRQKHIEHPLTNLHIFDSWRYRVSFWASNALYASFMGITLIIPLFVENQWGGTALQAGLGFAAGHGGGFRRESSVRLAG